MMECRDLYDLFVLFRNDGDKILNATSKLSLSTSLLRKMNEKIMVPPEMLTTSSSSSSSEAQSKHHKLEGFDLQILYDFIEKTLALKIFNDYISLNEVVDLQLFKNLKLLEMHTLSVNLIKGLKTLRSQLEFVACRRSVSTLKDVFEQCGGDGTQGYVWTELREAVFSHNNLNDIDASIEFVPLLEYLDLSHNAITRIANLNYLANLSHLNIANNRIVQLPTFSGPICNQLKILILRNNYIENIDGLGSLANVQHLDISYNCLIYFDSFDSLSNMHNLNTLLLVGNPICFQKTYRHQLCNHLPSRIAASKDFVLDNRKLSVQELRIVDSATNVDCSMPDCDLPSLESFHSSTTLNTVIEQHVGKKPEQTSDLEVSFTSVDVTHAQNRRANVFEFGMQDSGIVTGQRPVSPTASIGSASSLRYNDTINTKRYSESDIEILSNPSQSSIEVLCVDNNTPICAQSNNLMPCNLNQMCPDEELQKLGEEMHRSL